MIRRTEELAELLMLLGSKDESGVPGPGTQAWEEVRKDIAKHLAYVAIHRTRPAGVLGRSEGIRINPQRAWPLLRAMLTRAEREEA